MRVKKNIYEKYSLQEIDGKINDLFIKDMDSMNKLAFPMLICLKKYGCMILSRVLFFNKPETFGCSINYIFYDKDHSSFLKNADSILSSKFNGVSLLDTPPSNAGGFAYKSNIFIYIPIESDYLPFGKSVNLYKGDTRLSDSESKEIKKEIVEGSNILDSDCLINAYSVKDIDVNLVLQKFKDPLDTLKSYYSSKDLKQKTKIPLYNFTKYISTLKHELTHVYDTYKGSSSKNYFNFVSDFYKELPIESLDKTKVDQALYILYTLWSRTEFNAFTQSYGVQSNIFSIRKSKDKIKDPKNKEMGIGRPITDTRSSSIDYRVKELSSYISSLEDYNDLIFWGSIKEIAVNGNQDKQTKERINKMSPKEFKTYFIKTSKKQLEKFKEKTIKNSTQQALYNKDSQLLSQEIRKAIDDNITKHVYGKSLPFDFTMSFSFYFIKESASYKVFFSMKTDSENNTYLNSLTSFSRNIYVYMQCKKAGVDLQLSSSTLSEFDSFYNIYNELVTKQRKTYLDRIAIELADDIRHLLDNRR